MTAELHTLPTPEPPPLYPPQRRLVDAYCARKRYRRRIFAWGTGCGKTAGTWSVVRQVRYDTVLIVCPALVRNHWKREASIWAPGFDAEASVIEWGLKRSLTRAQTDRRTQDYAAPIVIVSYDLLAEVLKTGRRFKLIVLDELHHIASPKALVSKAVEQLLLRNPTADVLGLSATLIPTEATQLWNPLRLLFPHAGWGAKWKDGDVDWNFKWRYCHVEKTQYGHSATGVRDDRRQELRLRLLRHCDVLQREDIAADLPPLDLHILQLAQPKKHHLKMSTSDVADRLVAWTDSNHTASKLVILVHHRATAREIYDRLRGDCIALRNHQMLYCDGSLTTSRRDTVLRECDAARQCVLVGTHDSLNEGVRMMWADAAIIDEWSQSPGRMIQLMGRFQSVGSTRKPAVYLVADANSYGAAQQLQYRISVVQDVIRSSTSADVLRERLQAAGEPTDDDLAAAWADMFNDAGAASARSNLEDANE